MPKIQDFAALVFATCCDSIKLPVVKVVIIAESKPKHLPALVIRLEMPLPLFEDLSE